MEGVRETESSQVVMCLWFLNTFKYRTPNFNSLIGFVKKYININNNVLPHVGRQV